MSSEITGLDGFAKQLERYNFNGQVAIRANNAAAEVFIKHLKPKVPESSSKGEHLQDMITYKPGQYPDGSTDVGFGKKGFYFRFLNNGTAKMHDKVPPGGLHFMEHAFDEAKDEMRAAIARELRGGLP